MLVQTLVKSGPDTDRTRTKSAHVVGYELNSTTRTRPDPRGLCPCRVRSVSGPYRVRVVEFSYNETQSRESTTNWMTFTQATYYARVAFS